MSESDNVQRVRSEMRHCTTHALYQSQLWQQDHCQRPQNANLDGSTLEGTAQRIGFLLEVVERKVTTSKTRTKEFIKKVQVIIDETPQWPIWQIARDLGVSHTTVNACVKEDLKCRSYRCQTSQILTEKTKNLRLIKSVRPPLLPNLNPLDYFVWSYIENITNMTYHNTKASLIAAICRVFAKLPSALVEKACSHFRIHIKVLFTNPSARAG